MPDGLTLHPGLDVALRRFDENETDVVRALAAGEVPSPQKFENSTYFRVRISGTGYGYRPSLDEYVRRPVEVYSTPEFLERCNGLPVVWLHPKGLTLDSRSFSRSVVGTIVRPYLGSVTGGEGDDPNEPCGVARILVDEAAEEMRKEDLSTSPGVLLAEGEQDRETLDDGKHLLKEGSPSLIDHLAICSRGVWDKLGPPSGVDNGNARADSATEGEVNMADEKQEEKKVDEAEKPEDEKERADADGNGGKEGVVPDKEIQGLTDTAAKIADSLDRLHKRIDAYEAEKKADKKDGEAEDKEAEAAEEEKQAATLEKLAEEEETEAANLEKEARGDAASHPCARADGENPSDHSDRIHEMAGRCDASSMCRADGESKAKHSARVDALFRRRPGKKDAVDEKEAGKHEDGERKDIKKDADEDEEKMDNSKKDARIDSLETRLAGQDRELAALRSKVAERPADENERLVAAQARADAVYSELGDRAPPWMMGESVIAYRIRLARTIQKYAKDWKSTDLASMARHDAESFGNVESQIYDAAKAAARDPSAIPDGGLVQRVRTDSVTGQRIIEWYGDPHVWMSQFMPARQYATRLGREDR